MFAGIASDNFNVYIVPLKWVIYCAYISSKHDISTQNVFYAGPASQTVAQQKCVFKKIPISVLIELILIAVIYLSDYGYFNLYRPIYRICHLHSTITYLKK